MLSAMASLADGATSEQQYGLNWAPVGNLVDDFMKQTYDVTPPITSPSQPFVTQPKPDYYQRQMD